MTMSWPGQTLRLLLSDSGVRSKRRRFFEAFLSLLSSGHLSKRKLMAFTRRQFVRTGLAIIPAARLRMLATPVRPSSRFQNVQIGIIVSPYNYPSIPVAADKFLNTLVELGLSAVEMQDVRCEVYAGAPSAPREGYSGSPSEHVHPMSREEREAAERKQTAELSKWRLANTTAILEKYRTLRRLYQHAGVKIYALRLANATAEITDNEYNYFFEAARALGADQITTELPEDLALSQRLGDLAGKHKVKVGYHNHLQVNEHSWDAVLRQSKWNGIQLDVGHFVAAISGSPIPFITEHADRITSIHLKDRKYRLHGGQNLPWGQGDTPIRDVLLLMAKQHYKFPAGIELEYRLPAGSTPEKEIENCLDFCRKALA
jgi:sugar phosphate isomerase/epimerase